MTIRPLTCFSRPRLPSVIGAAGVLIAASLPQPAHGFMRWNGGREQVFLNLSGGTTWDSNIFASSGGEGDFVSNVSAGLEYQRRLGLISADASIHLASATFSDHTDENFLNPNLRVELSKETGRATGSLNLNTARESRADVAANQRTESWNHAASFLWKYPVIERYSLSGHFDYNKQDYADNTSLVDLSSYVAAVDIFYVYSTARDLMAGYVLRKNETSAGNMFTDHSLTAGLSGQILSKINGNVRFGYQFRQAADGVGSDSSWTTSGSATWTATERLNVTVQVSKDFSLTSTAVSVNTLFSSLDAQLSLSTKLTIFAGLNVASSKFLGDGADNREDLNVGTSVGLKRTLGARTSANLTWSYSTNWSTVAFSDFERQSVELSVSTRF